MVRARAGAVRDRSISGLGRDGRALTIAPKVLIRRSCAGERVMVRARASAVKSRSVSGLKHDGPVWPLRLRSLHADFCAGEHVLKHHFNS